MNYAIIMMIASAVYSGMRPILKKAVDDPAEEWDDALMSIADAVFGYKG